MVSLSRLRWRCICRFCGLAVLLLITVFVLGLFHFHHHRQCSVEQSKQLLQDLCRLYDKDEVDGSLCSALCKKSQIHFEKCTNYQRGKKVLFVQCSACGDSNRPVQAVFKTKKNLTEREMLKLPRLTDGNFEPELVKLAEQSIRTNLKFNFLTDLPAKVDIFSELWDVNFNTYLKNSKSHTPTWTAVQSIWSLTQQDEYLFMKLNQNFTFLPKIYGTCGPIYALEYCPPGEELTTELRPSYVWSSPWEKRARLALKFLDLVAALDSTVPEPLHLCDVKGENFGLSQSGELKLIDTDCAFFHRKMMQEFHFTNCTKHEDCDFFDCRGWCIISEGRCLLKRMNNNLQSICEDVFYGFLPKVYTGMLRGAPDSIKSELAAALDECAYPNHNIAEIVRAPATEDTRQKIRNLLLKSLER